MRKNKGISFRLSESEYQKVQDLAEQRHMSVTEYIRHTALGNRIKPTVVVKADSKGNEVSEDQKRYSAIRISDLEQEIELLNQENSKILRDNFEYFDYMQTLSEYVAENGFMNWHDYKQDEKVINILKYIHSLKE